MPLDASFNCPFNVSGNAASNIAFNILFDFPYDNVSANDKGAASNIVSNAFDILPFECKVCCVGNDGCIDNVGWTSKVGRVGIVVECNVRRIGSRWYYNIFVNGTTDKR